MPSLESKMIHMRPYFFNTSNNISLPLGLKVTASGVERDMW